MSQQTEKKLREELERLKLSSGLGAGLVVVWKPDGSNPLSGEVIGKKIQIYEADEDKAIDTLLHEFVDYNISQPVKPYRGIANALVKLVNAEAYACKEEVVDGFVRLLRQSKPPLTDDLTRSRRQSQ